MSIIKDMTDDEALKYLMETFDLTKSEADYSMSVYRSIDNDTYSDVVRSSYSASNHKPM